MPKPQARHISARRFQKPPTASTLPQATTRAPNFLLTAGSASELMLGLTRHQNLADPEGLREQAVQVAGRDQLTLRVEQTRASPFQPHHRVANKKAPNRFTEQRPHRLLVLRLQDVL